MCQIISEFPIFINSIIFFTALSLQITEWKKICEQQCLKWYEYVCSSVFLFNKYKT